MSSKSLGLTRDGQAVAFSTLKHLVSRIRCLTLFVTHFDVSKLEVEWPDLVNFVTKYSGIGVESGDKITKSDHFGWRAAARTMKWWSAWVSSEWLTFGRCVTEKTFYSCSKSKTGEAKAASGWTSPKWRDCPNLSSSSPKRFREHCKNTEIWPNQSSYLQNLRVGKQIRAVPPFGDIQPEAKSE